MYLIHLGTQFALIVLMFVFAGYGLDLFFGIRWLIFTFVFSLLGFALALYILVKQAE